MDRSGSEVRTLQETVYNVPSEAVHLGLSSSSSSGSSTSSSTSSSPGQRRHQRRLQIFFVPGNPGSLGFYLSFFGELHAAISAQHPHMDVELHAVAHAGHHLHALSRPLPLSPAGPGPAATRSDEGEDNSSRDNRHDNIHDNSRQRCVFNLAFQTRHKAAFMTKHIRPGSTVCLIGHSIGCYVAVDALALLPMPAQLQTSFVALLMPFFRWKNMPLLHRLQLSTFAATYPLSASLVLGALNTVPLAAKRALATAAMGDAKYGDMAAQVMHDVAPNFAAMGTDEITELQRPAATERFVGLLQAHEAATATAAAAGTGTVGSSTLVLYTTGDQWAPEADAGMLDESLLSAVVSVLPGLQHAFSMHAHMRAKVVHVLAAYLRRGLTPATSRL